MNPILLVLGLLVLRSILGTKSVSAASVAESGKLAAAKDDMALKLSMGSVAMPVLPTVMYDTKLDTTIRIPTTVASDVTTPAQLADAMFFNQAGGLLADQPPVAAQPSGVFNLTPDPMGGAW